MRPRFLLDTHIIFRWRSEPKKLSREQVRVIGGALHRSEPMALSAISLMEIALLAGEGRLRLKAHLEDFFEELQANPLFQILPMTCDIALEINSMGRSLRDPMDLAIVATARVHGLRLLTADQRIIESKLVSVVE